MKDVNVVILAAGDGTRMKSNLPKVLHKAAGLPLCEWVLRAAKPVTGKKPIMVYGSGGNALPEYFGEQAVYVKQESRLGSGHAVLMAKEQIASFSGEYTLVLAGDMPLIRHSSIQRLVEEAKEGAYDLLLLSGELEDPTGYGRIVRDKEGKVTGIVEEKDATEAQKEIREVNVSVYCFQTRSLLAALQKVTPQNAQGEYYLTDAVHILYGEGKRTGALIVDDFSECKGVNNRVQLAQVANVLRRRINEAWMMEGVTMIDPASVYIEADVTLGRDTLVYPGVVLEGNTQIGEGCILYQGSRIANSKIGDHTVVQNSVVIDSTIGQNTQVGPNAYLRPGSQIGNNCRIGDFVEIKNSVIDDGAKVSHLTYVGDGDIGKNVNVGCGVVFVNYDGIKKHRSTVDDGAFIGCNTNLISPVYVGKNAYIAAGTTVTKDVPGDSLCIGRAHQMVKHGWSKLKKKD